MAKKKYLPLYYEWMKTGYLPELGLCNSLQHSIGREASKKFKQLFDPKMGVHFTRFWGYDGYGISGRIASLNVPEFTQGFSPLRQTIVLFLAAMNNEL